MLVRKTGLFPRHVSSRQGLAEIRWGVREGRLSFFPPFLPRRLSCAADGRTTEKAMRANRPTRRTSLSGECGARGDDSLPTLGQAWLRE